MMYLTVRAELPVYQLFYKYTSNHMFSWNSIPFMIFIHFRFLYFIFQWNAYFLYFPTEVLNLLVLYQSTSTSTCYWRPQYDQMQSDLLRLRKGERRREREGETENYWNDQNRHNKSKIKQCKIKEMRLDKDEDSGELRSHH